MKSRLAMAIAVAAKATGLDNIKIVPVLEDTGIRHVVNTSNTPGWRDRIIGKAARIINNDIKLSLENNRDSVFYVYAICMDVPAGNPLLRRVELHYDIR